MSANYDSIDETYSIFAQTGPEYRGGLSNHGPMASEALCAMGHSDAVGEWAQRYKKRLESHPSALMRISEHDWRESLGKSKRVGDWIALFDEALKEASWRAVLDRWVGRLAPGIAAAAFHGVLRTAHAVRSLGERESAPRLHELAEGLGYWAATYQPLPRGGGGSRDKLPSRAIASVMRLPLERRVVGGFLTDGLAGLEGFEPFSGVIEMIDTNGDTSSLLSDLTETFARIYVKNAIGIGGAIAFIHCVTGPRAVRNMSPHLSEATVREAVRYAWQGAAGLYAAFAIEGPSSDEPAIRDLDAETLVRSCNRKRRRARNQIHGGVYRRVRAESEAGLSTPRRRMRSEFFRR